MSHRIVKVARQFNRPIKEVVEVIKQYGIEVLPKPTAMISDEMYVLIIRHYGGLPIGTIFQNEEAKAPKPLSVKEIKLEKIEEPRDIMVYGVMSTPGVVIDGKVVHAGGVPSREKVEQWLAAGA